MRPRHCYGPVLLFVLILAGCSASPTPPAPVVGKGSGAKSKVPVKTVSTSAESSQVLVRKGVQCYEMGDLRSAARFLEQAIVTDPTNRPALWRLAMIGERMAMTFSRPQSSPFYLRSAEMMRRLREAHPDLTEEEKNSLPNILYNEACTLAINGESARAISGLSDAIDAGFHDIAHIEGDPELDSIRRFPEFQQVTRRLEKRLILAMLASSKPIRFTLEPLKDLDGKAVSLADYRGKILVVDFWGTWCPPCRKQVPNLIELDRILRDKGVTILGLAYENAQGDEARKAVNAFNKEAGVKYPCLLGTEAIQNQIPNFLGYPTTLFLDRSGTVRLRFSGYQPLSTLEIAAEVLLDESRGNEKTGKENAKGKPSS